MMSDLRADLGKLGDAYHQLFMGRDTDAAEMAARHLAMSVEIQLQKAKI